MVALGRAALAGRAPAGVYHGTAVGGTTWYGLARETFRLSGFSPERISPVGSGRFPRPAARPACGVLGHGNWSRAGLIPLPQWDDQLTYALDTPSFAMPAVAARASGGRRLPRQCLSAPLDTRCVCRGPGRDL